MSTTCDLSKYDGKDLSDPHLYRSTVGALHCLSFIRPDIACAMLRVSKFMHQPKEIHWQAIKRILKYLKFTVSYALHFLNNSNHSLQGFNDVDWAADKYDRRSVGAYCIFHGSNLISWSCKKQWTIAHSNNELDYKALSNTTVELRWIQSILNDLRLPLVTSPRLWCDNIGATYLSSNLVFHSRTKNIEIDFHYIQDQVLAKKLHISFLSTKDQLTDLLTKPQSSIRFQYLHDNLHVQDLPILLRGCIGDKG